MKHPVWIEEARKYIGEREVTNNMSPLIKKMQKELGWEWLGAVPWCGIWVAYVLKQSNLAYPTEGFRAKAYINPAKKLDNPAVGCLVVFNREGGGHVGFVVGKTQDGRLMVLGANQGNAVTIAPFSTLRVVGYYWPSIAPHPDRYNLPIIHSNATSSRNEE